VAIGGDAAAEEHTTTGSHDMCGRGWPQLINMKTNWFLLGRKIDWDWLDGRSHSSTAENAGLGSRTLLHDRAVC